MEGTFTCAPPPARLLTGPLLVAAIRPGCSSPRARRTPPRVTAVVHVSSTLKVRSSTSLSSAIAGAVRNGQRVTVACVTPGQNVRGSVRTSNLWARLATGRYLRTPTSRPPAASPGAPAPQAVPVKPKPATGATAYQVGTVRSTDGKVNLRSGPSAGSAVKGSLASGGQGQPGLRRRRRDGQPARSGPPPSGTAPTTGFYISHAYVATPTLTLCKDAAGASPPPSTSRCPGRSSSPPRCRARSRAGAAYGVPPSVTIAQAILESGWGTQRPVDDAPQLLRHQVPERQVRHHRERLLPPTGRTSAPRPASVSSPPASSARTPRWRTRSATTATSCR